MAIFTHMNTPTHIKKEKERKKKTQTTCSKPDISEVSRVGDSLMGSGYTPRYELAPPEPHPGHPEAESQRAMGEQRELRCGRPRKC